MHSMIICIYGKFDINISKIQISHFYQFYKPNPLLFSQKMHKTMITLSILTPLVFTGDNNIILGDGNRIKGSDNVQVGFNTKLNGNQNWVVGNGQIVQGSGIKMFGPDADQYFINGGDTNTQVSVNSNVNNFGSFFDSFDPFKYDVPSYLPVSKPQAKTNNLRW